MKHGTVKSSLPASLYPSILFLLSCIYLKLSVPVAQRKGQHTGR